MSTMNLLPTNLEAPLTDVDVNEETRLEPLWFVLIHNDDVTPFDYVIQILINLFSLSYELAEHIAHTAHTEGIAVVVVRPKTEARRLVKVASAQARSDGYPLTFSAEPERA